MKVVQWQREKDLERQVRDWLHLRGWYLPAKPPFPKGEPDIIAMKEGRSLFVELKLPGKENRLSAKQLLKHKEIETWGNRVYICTTLEQVIIAEEEVLR